MENRWGEWGGVKNVTDYRWASRGRRQVTMGRIRYRARYRATVRCRRTASVRLETPSLL